jgi:hypothetical protein
VKWVYVCDVDDVNHMSLGTPCLQPEGLDTSSP